MAYRKNPTDRDQSVLENATFEGGAPVFVTGKTRVVAKGAQTASQKTSHSAASGSIKRNAGVIMAHDDAPGRFVDVTQGKA